MTKLPRDLSGRDLATRLAKLGYSYLRRESSHVILAPPNPGLAAVGVPDHQVLKVGMLSRILHAVSAQTGLAVEELIRQLKL